MSMPVLTGSLVRVPLGIWTDKFGGHRDGRRDGCHRARHLDDGLRHRILTS